MRIGVFSDVHSNLEALQAAFTYFYSQKVQQYIFIGDLVGYGASPNECIKLVKNLKCSSIAGNHDYGVLEKTYIEKFNDAAITAISWTKKELNQDSKIFLNSLPITNDFKDLALFHSTPNHPDLWEYIFTLEQAKKEFQFFKQKICFIGHSHCPFVVEYNEERNDFRVINDLRFKIKGLGFRYIINVGSVGQPRDGDTRACVVIFDTKTNYIEFKRLEYNIKLTQTKILKAGLPVILAYRLAQGK